jgi:adenylate cyclase class 2
MKPEIEAKFININIEDMRAKLRTAGAECEHPMRLMKRAMVRTPAMTKDGRDAFIRVRDEGDKITLTFKDATEVGLSGAKEIEIIVDSFDNTLELFKESGFPSRSYQENRRETWRLDSVEVVIDEWPHLNPYIEIEGGDEDSVKKAASKLGFDWTSAVFGGVPVAYQLQYPKGDAYQIINTPRLTFDDPLPSVMTGEKSGS